MYCHSCGAKLEEDALFCGECGAKQELSEQVISKKPIDEMKKMDQEAEFETILSPSSRKDNKSIVILLGVIIVLLLVAILLLLNRDNNSEQPETQIEVQNDSKMELERKQMEPAQDEIMEEIEMQSEPDAVSDTVRIGGSHAADEIADLEEQSQFILPDSDSEYLSYDDLNGIGAEELRIARNEIYARKGRKFQDEVLQAYFEGKDWYEGIYEPDEFQEEMLNEYEMFNRDLITEYEEEMGYR